MPNKNFWDLSRLTPPQAVQINLALDRCTFDWDLAKPGLRAGNQWSTPGKTSVPVTFKSLANFAVGNEAAEHEHGYHALAGVIPGERVATVLGLFWFDGRVEIEQSLVNQPALCQEVFLSEGAHASDFFYLAPNGLRSEIIRIYHPFGPDTHGYFDGPYFSMVGEAYMGGFYYATTGQAPSLLGFVHVTTPSIAVQLRQLLQITVPPPPPPPPRQKSPYDRLLAAIDPATGIYSVQQYVNGVEIKTHAGLVLSPRVIISNV